MPTAQEIEDYLRRMGQPIQDEAQAMGRKLDEAIRPADPRQVELQKYMRSIQEPLPQPMPHPGSVSQIPGGLEGNIGPAPKAQTHLVGNSTVPASDVTGGGPGPFQFDITDSDVQRLMQSEPQAQAAPAPRQFPRIQQKIQRGHPINKQDIRDTMQGAQEVTPELEKQLGYGKPDEEEEK